MQDKSKNQELLRLHTLLIEGVEGRDNCILRLSDLNKLYLILVHKLLENSSDKDKVVIIDAVKGMTNQFVSDLMARIGKEEISTIDESAN